MKKKEQAAYFDDQWNQMNTYLNAFILEGKQDDLHSFRVQVKRLRALFILFETVAVNRKNHLQRYFKPVRKVFKHAGEIRNAHVNLQLGNKYKIRNEQFETGQRQIIETGVTQFKLKGSKYLKKLSRAHKNIKNRLHPLSNKQIEKFYRDQLALAARDLAQHDFGEELHAGRRNIKIMVYNHKLVDDKLKNKLQLNNDYLDDLQGNIGDWHDNVLAIELFSSPNLDDKKVAVRITKKNNKQQQLITAATEDFLQKATSGMPEKEEELITKGGA